MRRGEVIFGLIWLAIGVLLALGWIQATRPVPQPSAEEGYLGLSIVFYFFLWLVGSVILVGVLITRRRRR
jgi:hypothetical protein